MKKLVIAALFVIGATFIATNTAKATDTVVGEQEQKQEAYQETTTTCSGAYNTECKTTTKQKLKQSQKQKMEGQVLSHNVEVRDQKIHIPAATALDTKSMIAALSISAVGGVAYAIRRKIA